MMRISDKGAELLRTDATQPARVPASDTAGRDPVAPVQPVKPVDRVQISDAGRALAARAEVGEAGEAAPALSVERTAEVRRRVLEGAYNSLDVVDQVARRMLERGHI